MDAKKALNGMNVCSLCVHILYHKDRLCKCHLYMLMGEEETVYCKMTTLPTCKNCGKGFDEKGDLCLVCQLPPKPSCCKKLCKTVEESYVFNHYHRDMLKKKIQ